jgi:hypothetical protein
MYTLILSLLVSQTLAAPIVPMINCPMPGVCIDTIPKYAPFYDDWVNHNTPRDVADPPTYAKLPEPSSTVAITPAPTTTAQPAAPEVEEQAGVRYIDFEGERCRR